MTIINAMSSCRFATLAEAVAAANPFDELQVTTTIDLTEAIHIDRPLSLVGLGCRPALIMRGLLPDRHGVLTTRSDIEVRNIELRGARSISGNGAGVWHQGGNLKLNDCIFRENQNGVMIAGGVNGSIAVLECGFIANGGGCGHTHGIYTNGVKSLRLYRCFFENTLVGHHVKSRAVETQVEHCYFSGAPSSSTSCAIDMPNQGIGIINRNLLIKSRHSETGKFISYGAEQRVHSDNQLSVAGNIFINHRPGPSVAVANYSFSVRARLLANAYERVTFALLGRGRDRSRRRPQTAIGMGV